MARSSRKVLEAIDDIGALVTGALGFLARLFNPSVPPFEHYDGPRLIPQAAGQGSIGGGELEFAGALWPLHAATKNFGLFGLPETGKSALLAVFLRALGKLLADDPSLKDRIIFFDAKNKLLPFLSQVLPPDMFIIAASPLSGYAKWDLAKDVTSPALALKFAEAFIPDSIRTSDDFWPKRVRLLVYAVILVLMEFAPGLWTLSDLLNILLDQVLARAVLKLSEETAPQAEDLTDRLGQNISASVRAYLGEMEIAAACYEHAAYGFTLSDLDAGRRCLHLGFDPEASVALRGLYAAMLDVYGDKILSQTDSPPRNWWLLDELAQLPPVKSIRRLGLLARESNGIIFATLQDRLSLEASWGQKEAGEFLNMLQTVACLRVGPETARWFCDRVGKRRVVKNSVTTNYGHNGGWSVSSAVEWVDVLTESDLTSLPLANPKGDVITGYVHTPFCDPFRFAAPFVSRLRDLPPSSITTPPCRTPDQQRLTRWNLIRVEELNLPPTDDLVAALTH